MNSIVNYKDRGSFGKNNYRGNTSGKIILDLHKVYKFNEISDYMSGSFTTKDVANYLNISSNCYDLNIGFDLIDNDIKERNEFIFWHPPYWDIVKFSGNVYGNQILKNDLSHIKDYYEFIKKLNFCLTKQFNTLERGGRIAILMADVKKNKKLYSMLLDINKLGTTEQIIIKQQNNCMSDNRIYSNNNFIKICHEYILILRKDNPLIIQFSITKSDYFDIRNSLKITWKDLVANVLESLDKKAYLNEIYTKIEGHKKCDSNKNWKEKIRQTLQENEIFYRIDRGLWGLT
ncbi:forkhead box transcription factor [Clostridioides sp. ZZV15-6597]|uniref:forkhead box transcription factor n=1 Tax=Clostridioides sp. ZZV15-6597 TaxID=2811500 RepID=UPI001C1B9D96|nr:DNA modification methylase [Clostridioides sp. ZZV15-6597]HBF5866215.1 DNA modification methylase [Clostridioides difficile]